MNRYLPALLAALALSVLPHFATAFAQGGAVRVTDAWARPTPPGAPTGAVYATIENAGSAADTLVSVTGAVADAIELHTVTQQQGMMQMRPVSGGIDVPAHGTVRLQPGGYHVMLIGLVAPIREGDAFALVFHFARAGAVEVRVVARTHTGGGVQHGAGGMKMKH